MFYSQFFLTTQRLSATALLFLFVTLVTLSSALSLRLNDVEEIPGKTVTLTSGQSSVEFNRIEWDPEEKVTVALRLSTHSAEGQFMLIKGVVQDNDETALELSLEIKRRNLSVYLYDESRNVIAKAEDVKKNIATGEEISLVLELNLKEKALGITLAKSVQARIQIEKSIPTDQKMDLLIYLGDTDDESKDSIIGCVTLVSVYFNTPVTFDIKTQTDDVINDCKNPCDGYNCNGGVCINEFNRALCDCFGTGRHGAQCETASSPVSITSENFIRYNLEDDEKQPDRIAFTFKVGTDVNEGLLLHASVESEKAQYNGTLSMELINEDGVESSISFRVTDLTTLNFPGFPKGEEIFHDVSLKFFYDNNEVQVLIDGEAKTATWELNDPTDRLIFSDVIYFGGSDDETANGIGLSGCLKEPYVGSVAVLDLLVDDNSKVSSSDKLDSCDDTPAVGERNEELTESPLNDKENEEESDRAVENDLTPTTEANDYDSITPTTTEGDGGDEENDSEEEQPKTEKKKPLEADLNFLEFFEAGDNSATESPLITCQPSDRMKCLNGGTCMKNPQGQLSCACDSGFVGIYCQFSDFPRTCQEAYDLGERVPGVYRIDVDGNGPLRDTYVDCENGWSTVPHNMPNKTVGRSHRALDQILPLTYRLFTPEQLGRLVQRSSDCAQFLRYDCNRAQLRFEDRQTWFESAAQPDTSFAQIGHTANACPCSEDNTCMYGKKCNCDANEFGTDDGMVFGLQAGITKIYVLQENGIDGRFTVGPLQCKGDAMEKNAVTMRSREITLETTKWRGESMNFWFRTNKPSGLLASTTSNGRRFQIHLGEGHLVEFRFNFNDGNVNNPATFERVVGIVSQSPLNDSSWHRVLVQVESNELRLNVDKQNKFYQLMGNEKLDEHTFNSPLIIGGDRMIEDGFIGCIKQLEIDGNPFDLLAAVRNVEDRTHISEGCQQFCSQESSPCRNDAECIEDYEAQSYYCVCTNPWIFSGRNCENNVNADTEVSFHDVDKAFLIYQDFKNNPLTNAIVFSFRTDQSDAILTYAHDENTNFVQVHLWEENKISLTLNNNRTVQRCTIIAEPGKEFSNMQWNQAIIVYGEKHTSLLVDRLMCVIDGPRLLSDSFITSFTEGLDYLTVAPPVSPVLPNGARIDPFTMLYVGGLPRAPGKAFRRLKRQASRSFYVTDYPSILGCMRGFRVGEAKVDLQYGGVRPTDRFAVRLGCNTQCDSLVCHNSGHCTVAWQNLDPNTMDASTCDCSKTSYFGGSCAEDDGLTFEGQAAFVFDMAPVLRRFFLPPKRKGDSFNFAFSSAVAEVPKHSRYLAVVQLTNSLKLEIILNKNGTVNAALILPPLETQVFTFRGNYSDGYRHFIQTAFRETSVTVVVDSLYHTFSSHSYQVTLASAEKIYLGGSEATNRTGGTKYFVGCMSNADIDFHLDARFRFTPMKYYGDTGSEFSQYTSTVPQEKTLGIGQCPAFQVPGALPPPQRTVRMPNWDAPFGPQKYIRATTPAPEKDSGGFPWWIIIVIVVILVLILLLVIALVCCIRKRTSEPGSYVPPPPPVNDDDLNKPVSTNRPNLYGDPHPIKDELMPLRSEVPSDPQVHHQHFPHHQPFQQQHKPPPVFGDNQVKPNLALPEANTHLEQNKRTRELFLNNPAPPASTGHDEQAIYLRDQPQRAPIARVSEVDADRV